MDNTSTTANTWTTMGSADYSGGGIYIRVNDSKSPCTDDKGISPILYFKYVKKQFKLLERPRLERRLKDLERAFNEAVENGQNALAEKFLNALALAARESAIYAKGIKYYVTDKDVNKYKHQIFKGHISNTYYEDYTRVIPKRVIKLRKELDGIFDDFVIYHYWNPDAPDQKFMDETEKAKMRDPILFGKIKSSDKLYFIADWQDEYCHLTFDKLISFMGNEHKHEIPKKPELPVQK